MRRKFWLRVGVCSIPDILDRPFHLTDKHKGEVVPVVENKDGDIHLTSEDVSNLFEKVKHGDESHQAWLKTAFDEFFEARRS